MGERVEVVGARFGDVDVRDAVFERVHLYGAKVRGVELLDVEISGELCNVTINGVDVAPLIEAELNRRFPDRVKMQPSDPAGFREAWDVVQRLWEGTVQRARALAPELLHERSIASGRSSRR